MRLTLNLAVALISVVAVTSEAATLTLKPNVSSVYPGQSFTVNFSTDAEALDNFGGCKLSMKGLYSNTWLDSSYKPNGSCYSQVYQVCVDTKRFKPGGKMVFDGWVTLDTGKTINQTLSINVVAPPINNETPNCKLYDAK